MGSSQVARKRASMGRPGRQGGGQRVQEDMVREGPTSQGAAELSAWLCPGNKKQPHGRDMGPRPMAAKTGALELPDPGQESERGQERLCQAKRRRRQSGQCGPWPAGTQCGLRTHPRCPGLGAARSQRPRAEAKTSPACGTGDGSVPGAELPAERSVSARSQRESLSGLNENTCPASYTLLARLMEVPDTVNRGGVEGTLLGSGKGPRPTRLPHPSPTALCLQLSLAKPGGHCGAQHQPSPSLSFQLGQGPG